MQCPSCKSQLLSSAKFCHECGLSLLDEEIKPSLQKRTTSSLKRPSGYDRPDIPTQIRKKIEAAQDGLSGTRKLVSIMFADVQGFTSLCEKLDPERVTDLMNRYLGRFGKIIFEYEGFVDKYIGDCIMALFGAPIAHENDPELAVRTAFKILEELKKVNLETGHNLSIRIGINAGMVLAGGVGFSEKLEFTVMGDAVNVAQRLQSIAEPNQIVVGASIAKACQHLFEFEALTSTALKGKTNETAIYRVVGFRKYSKDQKGIRSATQKMIGRIAERKEIETLISALKRNSIRSFLIQGEAGSGKSRLKLEAKKIAEAESIGWIDFRAHPLKSEVPYFGLKSFARHLLHPFIKIDSETKTPQLVGLQEIGIDSVHQLFLELLLELPQNKEKRLDLDATQWKRAIFGTLNLLLTKLGEQKKLVIFVDDIHLLDKTSLEYFWHFNDRLSNVLVCGAARPENFSIPSRFKVIDIQPLSETESSDLAKLALQTNELPPEFEKDIIRKSQGIPLFIGELIKAAQESGHLVQREEKWIYHQDSRAPLPDSLQNLILSRADRLYPADREVLEVAAILGRQFSDVPLRKILGNRNGIEESLQFLRQREFIFEISVSDGQTQYCFNHLLTQEVIYSSILVKKRSQIHSEIGMILRSTGAQGSIKSKAKFYEEASYHFQKSETHLNDAIECLMEAQKIRFESAEFEHASHLLETIESISKSSVDVSNDLRLDIQLRKLKQLKDSHRVDEAHEVLRQLEPTFNSLPVSRLKAEYHKLAGNVLALANTDQSPSLRHYQSALDFAENYTDSKFLAELLNDIGVSFLKSRSIDKASAAFENALQMAKSNQQISLVTKILMNLGSVSFVREKFEDAVQRNLEAVKFSMEYHHPYQELLLHQNLGLCYFRLKSYKNSLQSFNRAYELATSLELSKPKKTIGLYRHLLEWKVSSRLEKEEAFVAHLHRLRSEKEWNLYGEGISLMANVLVSSGDSERAKSEIIEAVKVLKENAQSSIVQNLESACREIKG